MQYLKKTTCSKGFQSKNLLRKTSVKGANATRLYTLPKVKIVCYNPVTSTSSGLKKHCTTNMTFRRLLWAGGTSCEFRLQMNIIEDDF